MDEWRDKLAPIIDKEVWQQIADLSALKYDNKSEQKVDINVSSLTKEERTLIHHLVKQLYRNKLVSKTIDQPADQQVEEQKIIRIAKPKPGRCKLFLQGINQILTFSYFTCS